MSSVLLFAADDGGTGTEAWITNADGTDATLIDLFAGPNGSFPSFYSKTLGDSLFFAATDTNAGFELFKSDGTVAGTSLFADIEFGPNNSNPFSSSSTSSLVIGETLYFTAFDSDTGIELYTTTEDGPVSLLRDLRSGSSNSNPDFLVDLGGTLIFAADDGTSGNELYRSDGTEAGTQRILDLNIGSGSSNPAMAPNNILNGELFFTADDGTGTFGSELYKTDGTSTGTTLVRDINPGALGSSAYGMQELNGTLYFAADDGSNGTELWRTDGTEGGTSLVKDINSGGGASFPGTMHELNGELIFFANDGINGIELWKTDGSGAGTTLVRNINPGGAFSDSYFGPANNATGDDIVIFKDKGYFVAFDGSNGIELWQTDGTTGGTVLFKDLNPGGGSSTPSDLIVADGLMYFGADDGTSGAELWVTDGTSAGTTLVKDVRVGANGSFAQPVGVIDINVAPEQATLSNNTTAENVAPGTTIGTLAAVDVDGDALTYTLTNDAGGRFSLSGNLLVTAGTLDFETAQSHSVTVQAADPSGATSSQTFTVNVTNVVEAPDAPTLSNATVSEASAIGTTIGNVAANNPEGGAVTFSLVDNANGLFTLNGTTLQTAGTLDADAMGGATQSITVRATGASNTTTDATFTLTVTDVNEAPTAVTLSGTSVAENAGGATVGVVSATDPDGDAITFTLTDSANGAFSLNGTTLQTTAALDFEAGGTRSVTIEGRDAGGLTSSQTFSINVTDVNEAPTAVMLTSNTVVENAAPGTIVGTVGASDPDGDALTFSLAASSSAGFTLNGTTLQTTAPFDFEQSATQFVTVEARDAGGLTSSQTFTVNVTDEDETPDTGVTLVGDAGANSLTGTALADEIAGGGGNDTLIGLAGDDTLRGDNGTDNILGGAGDDLLIGGSTQQDLRDNIFGGEGNDTIRGGYGNDEVRGDAGDDLVEGGFGADTVFGGSGNDSITGSGFGDLLFGADGNDFINGGFGFDRTNGGSGADEFFHLGVEGHGTDFIQDYDASEGDVLVTGIAGATADQFQINYANTANAGSDGVDEAFVIYIPTKQIMWALIDGAAQDSINLQVQGDVFDLMG